MATLEIWVEKYRPKNLDEILGHKDIVKALKGYVAAKNMPHLLFAGPPGTGKTSAAIALARELYGDKWRENFLELNASDARGIDVIRSTVKEFARMLPTSGAPFKIIFLDEADQLTQDAQAALRRIMEMYASTCRFILSCNYSSRIIEPIQSRCAIFRFRPLGKEETKKIIQRIAEGEGLTVKEDAIDALYYISEGDLRRAINILQAAAMLSKEITGDLIYRVSATAKPEEIEALVKTALEGKFEEARKKLYDVLIEYGLSGEDVLKQIHRVVRDLDIPDELKLELIDRVGEIEYRLVEGSNERIQLEALLAYIGYIGKRLKGMKK